MPKLETLQSIYENELRALERCAPEADEAARTRRCMLAAWDEATNETLRALLPALRENAHSHLKDIKELAEARGELDIWARVAEFCIKMIDQGAPIAAREALTELLRTGAKKTGPEALPPANLDEVRARWADVEGDVFGEGRVEDDHYGFGLAWGPEGGPIKAKIGVKWPKLAMALSRAPEDIARLLAEVDRMTGKAQKFRALVEESVHELRNALLPATMGEGAKKEARVKDALVRGLELSNRLAKALREDER